MFTTLHRRKQIEAYAFQQIPEHSQLSLVGGFGCAKPAGRAAGAGIASSRTILPGPKEMENGQVEPPAQESLPVAPAPREAKPNYTPVLGNLLRYVEDPAFQKELRLTEKQVQQLLTLRQKEWDYFYNLSYKEWSEKRAEHDKVVTAAIKDLLTPEQATYAERLAALRLNWHPTDTLGHYAAIEDKAVDFTRVAVHHLKGYPELAAMLNLSDEQKKLTERERPDPPLKILLTAEQSEILRKRFGDTRNNFKLWTATRDPRTSVVVRSPLEIANTYASDLKITPEQATAIGKPDPRYRSRYEANPVRPRWPSRIAKSTPKSKTNWRKLSAPNR